MRFSRAGLLWIFSQLVLMQGRDVEIDDRGLVELHEEARAILNHDRTDIKAIQKAEANMQLVIDGGDDHWSWVNMDMGVVKTALGKPTEALVYFDKEVEIQQGKDGYVHALIEASKAYTRRVKFHDYRNAISHLKNLPNIEDLSENNKDNLRSAIDRLHEMTREIVLKGSRGTIDEWKEVIEINDFIIEYFSSEFDSTLFYEKAKSRLHLGDYLGAVSDFYSSLDLSSKKTNYSHLDDRIGLIKYAYFIARQNNLEEEAIVDILKRYPDKFSNKIRDEKSRSMKLLLAEAKTDYQQAHEAQIEFLKSGGVDKFGVEPLQEFIKVFNESLYIIDRDKGVFTDRGMAYYHVGEYEKSIEDLERGLTTNQFDNDVFQYHKYLNKAYKATGNNGPERYHYREALRSSDITASESRQMIYDNMKFFIEDSVIETKFLAGLGIALGIAVIISVGVFMELNRREQQERNTRTQKYYRSDEEAEAAVRGYTRVVTEYCDDLAKTLSEMDTDKSDRMISRFRECEHEGTPENLFTRYRDVVSEFIFKDKDNFKSHFNELTDNLKFDNRSGYKASFLYDQIIKNDPINDPVPVYKKVDLRPEKIKLVSDLFKDEAIKVIKNKMGSNKIATELLGDIIEDFFESVEILEKNKSANKNSSDDSPKSSTEKARGSLVDDSQEKGKEK